MIGKIKSDGVFRFLVYKGMEMLHILKANLPVLFVLMIFIFSVISADSFQEKEYEFEWVKIRSAWSDFYYLPTKESLNHLYEVLPSKNIYERPKDNQKVYFVASDEGLERSIIIHIWMLEKEINSGNLDALRVCFKLMNISSKIYSEPNLYDKCKNIIGDLVRINPKLFLTGLKEIHENSANYSVGGMNTIRYTDRAKAILREAKLRIEALMSVKDKNLRELRNQCIDKLESVVEEFERIVIYAK